ncbi:MAG: hypothetical protein QOF82_966 [Frankiales bacterium]|nr:hypothetical protein [Frankiales bacterium]
MSVAPPLLPGTAEQAPAPPARSWSGREHAKRYRGLAVVVVAVVVVAIAAVLITRHGTQHGTMDPQSYDPDGGHALAALVADRGVPVTRLTDIAQVTAAAGSGTTVVVADPAHEQDLSPLRRLPAGITVVLIAPDVDSLAAVQPGLVTVGSFGLTVKNLDCNQPDAVLAGSVYAGGDSYARRPGDTTPSQTCYDGTLYAQPAAGGGGFVDIGSAATLSNANLGRDGNAALGIGLLSHGTQVLWLVPGPVHLQPSTDGTTPLSELLPGRLGWAVLQAVIAAALLMLWRARRLGRVVPEPLPVVIRASETVEGQGRLYRAGRARRRAATALRAAAVARMAPRLGVRHDDAGAALVAAVAARTGRSPTDVAALLYGAEPEDDRALVALADQLDALEAEVRRT